MTFRPLLDAVIQLDNAIDQLLSPRFRRVETPDGEGYVASKPSLYDEMAANPQRQREKMVSTHSHAKSSPPMSLEAVDWVLEVDRTIGSWGSLSELCTVAAWRPEDVDEILRRVELVNRWCRAAEDYLNSRATFPIRAACPECAAETVSRREGGETIRTPALQAASDLTACCLACSAQWQAEDLAKLLA